MGFRFRKSVKLLPGLRLNLSKSGVSLSAGIPGAHINFSPRGARTTFGVPGTGFAWSANLNPGQVPQRHLSPVEPEGIRPIKTTAELEASLRTPRSKIVYTDSGRKLSSQQLEALHRRLALEEWRQEAQARVDKFESDLAERLNSWREAPSIPSDADYQAALKIQPFRYDIPESLPPNYQDAQTVLERSARQALDQEITPTSKTTPLLVAILSLAAGVFLGVLGSQTEGDSITSFAPLLLAAVLSLGGLGASIVIYKRKNRARSEQVNTEVTKRIQEQWPAREQELRSSYEAEVARYNAQKSEAEQSWQKQEHDRIVWASKLIAGDEATIHGAVCHTLADLDFPFETYAAFAVEDARTGYLHLDLPEIENLIPDTRHQVLKVGRFKKVKRHEGERNAQYCDVACGVGLMMASATFAAAPSLQMLSIAAYTQRQQKGTGDGQIVDDYVYVVSIPRTAFSNFEAISVNPAFFITNLSACMDQQTNCRFQEVTG